MARKVEVSIETLYKDRANAEGKLKALQKLLQNIIKTSQGRVHTGPYSQFTKVTKQIGIQKAVIDSITNSIAERGKVSKSVDKADALRQKELGKIRQSMWTTAEKTQEKYNKSITRQAKFQRTAFKDVDSMVKKINKDISKQMRGKHPFAGWAMSIMFFGMALKRMFDQVWKSSTKTFQEIAHSVENTVTGFDMLEGSMKFLQFVVGNALEPIAYSLVPIIDRLSEIIDKNPELTRGIVMWSGILGSVFMVGGAGVLALNGFLDLSDKILVASGGAMGLAKQLAALAAVGYVIDMVIDFAKSDIAGGIVSAFEAAGLVALVTGRGALGGALFSIGAVIDLVGAIVEGGGSLTKATLQQFFLKTAPGAFFISPGIGAALLTVGIAMQLMGDEGWTKFYSLLGIAFGTVMGVIALATDGLLAVVKTIVNAILFILNQAINTYNLITRKNVDKIGYLDVGAPFTEKSIARIEELLKQFQDAAGVIESSVSTTGISTGIAATNKAQQFSSVIDASSLADFMSGVQKPYEKYGAQNIYVFNGVQFESTSNDPGEILNAYLRTVSRT